MLSNSRLLYPNISENQIQKWAIENLITLNPNIRIKRTSYNLNNGTIIDGGIGLFYNYTTKSEYSDEGENSDKYEEEDNKDIELMRIPKGMILSLHTIMSLISDLSDSNSKSINFKNIISCFIRSASDSEKSIITNFIASLFFILRINENKKNENYKVNDNDFEILKKFEIYLEILMKTKVNLPGMKSDDYKDLKGSFLYKQSSGKYDFLNYKYEQLLKSLEELNDNNNSNQKEGELESRTTSSSTGTNQLNLDLFTIDDFILADAVVRSRCLELPSIEDPDISTTVMIPILDFANHDQSINKLNAYYILDSENGDCSLMLDIDFLKDRKNKNEGGSEFEIFIRYDDEEEINEFVFKYGMIPRSQGTPKYLDIILDKDYWNKALKDKLLISETHFNSSIDPLFFLRLYGLESTARITIDYKESYSDPLLKVEIEADCFRELLFLTSPLKLQLFNDDNDEEIIIEELENYENVRHSLTWMNPSTKVKIEVAFLDDLIELLIDDELKVMNERYVKFMKEIILRKFNEIFYTNNAIEDRHSPLTIESFKELTVLTETIVTKLQ